MTQDWRHAFRLNKAVLYPSTLPTLKTLTLDNYTVLDTATATTFIANVLGTTVGSTLSLTNSDGGRFALSGSKLLVGSTALVDGARTIVITETLAGATNTPHATTLTVTVSTVPNSIDPPILVLSSNTTYPPPLSVWVDATPAVQASHTLEIQASTSVAFGTTIFDDTLTITDTQLALGSLSLPGLSTIANPTQAYFRAKIDGSAWGPIVKHGDTTPPVITSSATPNVNEGVANPTGTLTANEDIARWGIVGGPDAASFSVSGATWTLNLTPSYATQPQYVVQFIAFDYAGNTSTQTMTLTINPLPGNASVLSGWAKSQYIDRSNANLTATSELIGWGALARIRSTYPRTGKLYFEVTIGSQTGVGQMIGVCTTSLDMTSNGPPGTQGAILRCDGYVWDATGAVTSAPIPGLWYAPGDVMGVAIDTTAHQIFFTKDGTYINLPQFSTGGWAIPTGSLCVLLGLTPNTGGTNAATVNFAGPFVHAVPTGYSAFT